MLCAKMDAVTYPHAQVIAELEDWVFARVDVSQHRKVAAAFGVPAVPVAVAVEPGGTILGRVPSFVEPEAFADWLRALDGTSASDE